MSWWLLCDWILFQNPYVFPCFFLVGFVTDKKTSWCSILAAILLFDWILLETKFLFAGIFLLLKIIQPWITRNKVNIFLQFLIFFVLFFSYFAIIQQIPLTTLFTPKLFWTYFFSNIFLLCYIKNHSYA